MTDEDARRALRENMRSRRSALAPNVRLAAAEALATQLRHLDVFAGAQRVAGYWAVRGELPLHALLAPPPDFTYCLPILTAERTLRFAPWRFGEALTSNRYGIPEPDVPLSEQLPATEMDIVLLPLLAFDRRGTRLGSGAGYYDRSFEFLRHVARPARPLLIGVAYGFQEIEHLHDEPWDVPLDYIATDGEVIRVGT